MQNPSEDDIQAWTEMYYLLLLVRAELLTKCHDHDLDRFVKLDVNGKLFSPNFMPYAVSLYEKLVLGQLRVGFRQH